MPSVVRFLFPSEGLHHENLRVVLFLFNGAVESLDS